MPQIKFRFSTECELTLKGDSYEEIYLQFKDLCHGDQSIEQQGELMVYPPEDSRIFFDVDAAQEFYQIDMLKGDFIKDILHNCPPAVAHSILAAHYH